MLLNFFVRNYITGTETLSQVSFPFSDVVTPGLTTNTEHGIFFFFFLT